MVAEQQIRFHNGIAYATTGSGPPLVVPGIWIGHLERDWELPKYRAFFASLAEARTVIRYGRRGTGLSDREASAAATDAELAELADALELAEFDVLSVSWGGCALRDRFARLQRAAATAEVAAATLERIYAVDLRDRLGAVTVPALVLHRRADRAIPYDLGRDLAAALPDARLVPLTGEYHLPWLGASAPVLAALHAFLDDAPPATAPAESPSSAREQAVLRLVAAGLADTEIAERLVVSPHTVHRHVANIGAKLGQPSRAAAVAYATRRGLI